MKAIKVHIAIIILCFITIIIALYFGMSIYNAMENQHITHLNSFDNHSYNSVNDITLLTAQAVILSSAFITASFIMQFYSYFLSKTVKIKRIILGTMPIYFILFFFAAVVMLDYKNKDFYHYGMIWVLLSVLLIFANGTLIIIRNKRQN